MPQPYRTAPVRKRIPPDGPIAYLVTFRTYGTWLPGDERGWIHRKQNLPQTPYAEPCQELHVKARNRLNHSPVILDDTCREVVFRAIQDVCCFRGWDLHAVNVLPTHVHLVVSLAGGPERAMNTLKSWATRRMVEEGVFPAATKGWSRHGSTRYLWDEKSLEDACGYVVYGQGDLHPGRYVAKENPLPHGRGTDHGERRG